MKHLKPLGLVVVLAAVSLMTWAGTASADRFTSPSGTTYTSSIMADSGNVSLDGSFVTVHCEHSVLEAQVEKHSFFGFDTGGVINYLSFGLCNYSVKVEWPGAMDVSAEGGGNGDFQLFSTQLSVATSVGTCVFTASGTGTTVGSFTGSSPSNPVIDLSGKIPRTGGNFLCGSSGTLTGSYEVVYPSTLTVD
jgi:hypothetical protein